MASLEGIESQISEKAVVTSTPKNAKPPKKDPQAPMKKTTKRGKAKMSEGIAAAKTEAAEEK